MGNAAFECANHTAGEEGSAEVDGQPHPAVFHGIKHGSEQVFVFLQTGHVQHIGFGFFTNHVHHFVHGQAADKLTIGIGHGCGYQVVTLKRLRGFFGVVFGAEAHNVSCHDVLNDFVGVGHEELADGQHAL